MAANNPQARVSIFIDAQNLYHSAKHLHGARVNFAELVQTVAAGRPVIRTLAYVVKSEGVTGSEGEPAGERSFFEALRNAGIELRLKDLQVFAGGAKKADWDVGLAVDAIRTAGAYDVAVLATGDGDFVPLVEYLRWGLGKQVEVASFGKATSGKLRDVADHFTDLDEVRRILIPVRARLDAATPRSRTSLPRTPRSQPRRGERRLRLSPGGTFRS